MSRGGTDRSDYYPCSSPWSSSEEEWNTDDLPPNATAINQLDFGQKNLTTRFRGLYFRFTDAHGRVTKSIFA